jgi:phage tail-like protein
MSIQEYSKYTQYLPRIFQKGTSRTDDNYFLGRFLMAFEQILTGGTGKQETSGIEELLDSFDRYLDPELTSPQLLEWLAGWVALDLEETTDFYGAEDKEQKDTAPMQLLPLNQTRSTINRKLIGAIVQLYKERGTCNGLLEFLQLYAGEETTISIDEFHETARIGDSREIGRNTMVGGASSCFFAVNAIIPAHSRNILNSKVALMRRVIESEKPFYTNYKLNVEIPSMRIGVYSKVGKETLVGGMIED